MTVQQTQEQQTQQVQQTAETPAQTQAESQASSVSQGTPDSPQQEVRALNPAEGNAGGQKPEARAPEAGLLSQPVEEEDPAQRVLGAPEGGEYKFEPSPDSSVHMDEESLKAFGGIAKELNLSQEAAQKIVNGMEPLLAKTVSRNRAIWGEAARQDPQFGGADFENNMKAVRRAYAATTTEGFRQILQASGLDSHPEVIRHFYELSQRLGEGKYITSSGASERGDGRDPRDFYKGMNA